MNRPFVAGLNDSSSSTYLSKALKVIKEIIKWICIFVDHWICDILEALQVISFSSVSNGTSIIPNIIVIVNKKNISSAAQIQSIIQNGITNGNLSLLNVSQSYSMPLVRG